MTMAAQAHSFRHVAGHTQKTEKKKARKEEERPVSKRRDLPSDLVPMALRLVDTFRCCGGGGSSTLDAVDCDGT